MTGRERVLAALSHTEADRVPLDLGSTVDTTIHYAAYQRLLRHLGLMQFARPAEQSRYLDLACGAVEIDQDVLMSLKVDTRGVVPPASSTWEGTVRVEDGSEVIRDRLGATWTRSQNGYYFDQRPGGYPLANLSSLDDFDDSAWWTQLEQTDWIGNLRGRLEAWRNDYAIVVGDPFGGLLALGFRMRGYEQFYIDLASNPQFACGLMDRFVEFKSAYWASVLAGVGDLIDIVVYEDDLGQQDRTLLSPSMYRKLVKPRQKRLFEKIARQGDSPPKILMHSDGAISEIIPDLIEIGVDILNPIQVSAAGMDPALLKRTFGDDLVFWGAGADSQGVLSFGTPAEVRSEVERHLSIMAPGGGYVFTTIHNIQPEVPPENVMAMLQALEDFGEY